MVRSSLKTIGVTLLVSGALACSQKPDDSAKVLAIINGQEITAGEFDRQWSQIPEFAQKTYAGTEGRTRFLDELITRELLLQEAYTRGFDRERPLLERVERFKERAILDRLVREEVDARVTVTPDELKAYYEANQGAFTATDAPLSFEEAQDLVKEQLLVEKKRKRFDELVASLRAKAKLRVADVPIPVVDVPAANPAAAVR